MSRNKCLSCIFYNSHAKRCTQVSDKDKLQESVLAGKVYACFMHRPADGLTELREDQ